MACVLSPLEACLLPLYCNRLSATNVSNAALFPLRPLIPLGRKIGYVCPRCLFQKFCLPGGCSRKAAESSLPSSVSSGPVWLPGLPPWWAHPFLFRARAQACGLALLSPLLWCLDFPPHRWTSNIQPSPSGHLTCETPKTKLLVFTENLSPCIPHFSK